MKVDTQYIYHRGSSITLANGVGFLSIENNPIFEISSASDSDRELIRQIEECGQKLNLGLAVRMRLVIGSSQEPFASVGCHVR